MTPEAAHGYLLSAYGKCTRAEQALYELVQRLEYRMEALEAKLKRLEERQ